MNRIPLDDLLDKRFGNLTVIGIRRKNMVNYWVCQCDCGNVLFETTTRLHHGNITSCAPCRRATSQIAPPELDLKQRRFDKLIVLHHLENCKNFSKWLCQCDCGGFVVTTRAGLLSGHRKSCEQCVHKKRVRVDFSISQPINDFYVSYYHGAIRRGLSFDITREQFTALVRSNCYYCNAQPQENRKNPAYAPYNGIDRIDSSLGYSDGNVRPCCKRCNVAKSDMTEWQFLDWLQRASAHMTKERAS